MIIGGIGGANTTTGIRFEGEVDLLVKLAGLPGYEICGNATQYHGRTIAYSYRKHSLYAYLAEQGIDWKDYISKRLLPDDAIYVVKDNTVYIIEIKFQQVAGSVDEKLQTCDFKKKRYQKLFSALNYDVEFIYILNDWFKNESYRDVLDYIVAVGCHYYFEYLPLERLGLPVPEEQLVS